MCPYRPRTATATRLVLGLLAAVAAPGCGPTCSETCTRLFQPDQCNIEHPGVSQEDQQRDCMDACESALNNPGGMGDYEPYERLSGSKTVKLETDQQAATWMECVAETSCEYLEDGYCAPVLF